MKPNDEAIVARLFREVWSDGNLSILSEIMHSNCTAHSGTTTTLVESIEQYRQFVAGCLALYGDVAITVDAQVASAGIVATRWTARLASAPDEPGLMGMSFHTVRDGLIAECWDTWDSLRALEVTGADALTRLTMAHG